jgi:hypothetical protein
MGELPFLAALRFSQAQMLSGICVAAQCQGDQGAQQKRGTAEYAEYTEGEPGGSLFSAYSA